jgi:hypothetical protein
VVAGSIPVRLASIPRVVRMNPTSQNSQHDELADFTDMDFRALAHDLLTTPIVLLPEYLKLVQWQEELPCNRNGADKSWVWRSERDWRNHYDNARRVS